VKVKLNRAVSIWTENGHQPLGPGKVDITKEQYDDLKVAGAIDEENPPKGKSPKKKDGE